MRLIKPNDYDEIDMKIAYLGDAISHPVRKRIIEHLFSNHTKTKTDLSRLFNLSKPVMAQHMQKLKEAEVVEYNYSLHFEMIQLNVNEFQELLDFLIEIGVRPSAKIDENS